MPIPVTSKLPKPKSADEFEDIVTDLFGRYLDAPVHRNGRSGQRQHGVDLYAKPRRLAGHHLGVQCKNVESLTLAEIKAELAKASDFKPALAEYWIVTSLDRDATLQTQVRLLNEERRVAGESPIEIWFWDDVAREISGHDDLLQRYGWLPKQDPAAAKRAEKCDEIASRALKATLQCRAVTLSGVALADHGKRARKEYWLPRPFGSGTQWSSTLGAASTKWNETFLAAKAEAEEVFGSMRVHWGDEHTVGLDGLAHVISYMVEWQFKLTQSLLKLFNQRSVERKNFGPCDWDAVFDGDATERAILTKALDQRLAEVEQWAKPYILTRSA